MAEHETSSEVRAHLSRFFEGHTCQEHVWTLGPAQERLPQLRVCEFAPGPTTALWLYASIGAWEARDDSRLEFLLAAPERDLKHVELVSSTAWYHWKYGLGVGHTFPIGEPWLPGSTCEFLLVSLPYLFESLEIYHGPAHVRFVWLLPITGAERDFKVREGVDALESRFEEGHLEFWKPERPSMV